MSLGEKRILEYIRNFEIGGGLDSDAVVPPLATAPENKNTSEKTSYLQSPSL